jgi:two-component system cell cycle response regulator
MDKQLKVLVVDGSRVSRSLIRVALASHSASTRVNVETVGSAVEALDRLSAEKFDLITSSLQLPDMYGLDLCRTVRSQPGYRYTPFIVVTAEPYERHMKEGFRAGVNDYYDKTRGMDEFMGFARGLVDRYAALSGKVLYVEDSNIEAALLAQMMEAQGLTVARAQTAEEALQMVDHSYDAVVTDFFLHGDLSGGDFLHALRCGKRMSEEQLPVLVITGSGNVAIQAEIFQAGANDFVVKPVVEEVFLSRLRSLLATRKRFTLLHQQSEELRRMASLDILTGVYNRRYLIERANRFLADPANHPAWVVVLDLDHFKSINDQHGHAAGDRVLQSVGALFRGFFRAGDVIARSGGEEFVLLLRDREREEVLNEMEALRQRVEALNPEGLPLTASIGIAAHVGQADFELIQEHADRAMYRAKELGRNRVVIAGTWTRQSEGVA